AGEPAHAKPILPFTSTGALGDLPTTVNSAPVSSVVFHTDDGTYTVSSSMGSQTFSGGMIESAGSASALPGPYMVYNFANITIGPSTKVTVDESSPLVLAAQTNATITGTINVTGLAGTPGGFGTGAA